jgi:hypothetical protein
MIGRRRSLPHDRPFGQPFEGFTQALRRLSRSMFSSWRSGLVVGTIEASRKPTRLPARSEWDSEFRTDLAAFLDDELIEKAIDHGRPLELVFVLCRCERRQRTRRLHDCNWPQIGDRFVIDLVRGTRPGVAFDHWRSSEKHDAVQQGVIDSPNGFMECLAGSFALDVRCLDDWPPFLDLSLL